MILVPRLLTARVEPQEQAGVQAHRSAEQVHVVVHAAPHLADRAAREPGLLLGPGMFRLGQLMGRLQFPLLASGLIGPADLAGVDAGLEKFAFSPG